MIASESRLLFSKFGPDSPAALHHEEVMYAGLMNVTDYFAREGRVSRPLTPSDIVCLDPHLVAERLENNARPEAKIGIAHTVGILIQHARTFLEKMEASQATPSSVNASTWSSQTRKPSTNGRTPLALSTHPAAVNADTKDEFPLEAYCAVYQWLGKWSQETDDQELRAIARAASKSLHAVGLIILQTMRFMRRGAK
jgi:hypothetical protein